MKSIESRPKTFKLLNHELPSFYTISNIPVAITLWTSFWSLAVFENSVPNNVSISFIN